MSTSSTTTGEFHPNIGKESNGGAMLPFGSTLFYFSPDSKYQLQLARGDISALIASGDLQPITQDSAWSREQVSKKISNSNGANFKSKYRTALTVVESKIYMFWTDTHNGGQVYATWLDTSSNTWATTAFLLKDANGDEIQIGSDVSVCNIRGQLKLSWFDTSAKSLCSSLFVPEDIDAADHEWEAHYDDAVLALNDHGLSVDSSYYAMSTQWLSQGNSGDFVVAAFYSTDKSKVQSLIVPINRDPEGQLPIGANTSGKTVTLDSFSARKGVQLSADPSGRIYCVHGVHDNSKDYVNYRLLSTFGDFSEGGKATWGDPAKYNDHSTNKAITAGFIFGPVDDDASVELQGTSGQTETLECTKIKTYVFVMYARGDSSDHGYKIRAECQFYGKSALVPDYNEYAPDANFKDFFTLGKIFDPFPFPNQNLGSAQPGDSMIEYVYGTSSATELTAEVSWRLQFGIRSEFNTDKGVGPALESEFKTGPSGSIGTSVQTRISEGTSMATAVVDQGGETAVSPRGRAGGTTLPVVKETASLFYDAVGTLVSGTGSQLFSALIPDANSSRPQATGYDVYSATPGDMSSYSEAEINKTMKALYEGLSDDEKAYFTAGYASDYIKDVIEPNAHMMPTGAPYLRFRIDPDSGSKQEFEAINSTMISAGWSIEGSTYLGVGFGEELSLFGAGVGFSGKVLAGFEYGLAVTGGIDDSKSWGVTAEYDYPKAVPGALGYSVRMYVCKPHRMWARELQFMADNVSKKDKIDWDGSVPMKIIFVVDDPETARR